MIVRLQKNGEIYQGSIETPNKTSGTDTQRYAKSKVKKRAINTMKLDIMSEIETLLNLGESVRIGSEHEPIEGD